LVEKFNAPKKKNKRKNTKKRGILAIVIKKINDGKGREE
jgi:hypothetical protein